MTSYNQLLSLPMYSYYSNLAFEEIPYYGVSIKWNSNTNNSMIAEITKHFLDIAVNRTGERKYPNNI